MKKPAFTLIEIMVSVAIMLLLTGMAMVTMSGFNNRQKSQGVRSEVRSMLELTRNYAQTMQYPTASTKKPDYYKLSIASNIVTIEAHFDDGSVSPFDKNKKDFSAEGVVIAGDTTICFKPFEAILSDLCGAVTTKRITFDTYSLEVNTNGQISEL